MVTALLDLVQQRDDACSTFGLRQLGQRFSLLGSPFSGPARMTAFVQPGQTKLFPALPPLLHAIQVHHELVSSLLQGQALA